MPARRSALFVIFRNTAIRIAERPPIISSRSCVRVLPLAQFTITATCAYARTQARTHARTHAACTSESRADGDARHPHLSSLSLPIHLSIYLSLKRENLIVSCRDVIAKRNASKNVSSDNPIRLVLTSKIVIPDSRLIRARISAVTPDLSSLTCLVGALAQEGTPFTRCGGKKHARPPPHFYARMTSLASSVGTGRARSKATARDTAVRSHAAFFFSATCEIARRRRGR